MIPEVSALIARFDQLGYVVEEELATVLLLTMKLQKPILLEGPPGVGKTEAAYIMASHLETELIRLQCYEGLDVNTAIYEWNYQKQLLSIKINEKSEALASQKEDHIFGEDFLLKRPLLKAITAPEKAPVLLIDEIDRADEEFEAYLLELLSDFRVTIPEMGTITATHRPIVLLTSNRTRELSDALRRRCLYHWIDFPSFQKEFQIVSKNFPTLNAEVTKKLVTFIEHLRGLDLEKVPGIAETLDWTHSLLHLSKDDFDSAFVEQSLGCILKSAGDIKSVRSVGIDTLLKQLNT